MLGTAVFEVGCVFKFINEIHFRREPELLLAAPGYGHFGGFAHPRVGAARI